MSRIREQRVDTASLDRSTSLIYTFKRGEVCLHSLYIYAFASKCRCGRMDRGLVRGKQQIIAMSCLATRRRSSNSD